MGWYHCHHPVSIVQDRHRILHKTVCAHSLYTYPATISLLQSLGNTDPGLTNVPGGVLEIIAGLLLKESRP